jgi:hypothetical protein
MERGLLANIFNIPPLIFRFQYNPDILQEKKRYKYQQANRFGQWAFDQTTAGAQSGTFDALSGLWEDLKEIGPLLTRTKPYEPLEGEPRKYTLEFKLDASQPGPQDIGDHFGGSIEPDLAVLRSFMYPSYSDLDLLAFFANGIFKGDWKVPCWNAPPLCTLVYGPLSFDCIMEDLDIKITDFQEDLSPLRAEVKVSLAEQTLSTTPVTDLILRYGGAIRALGRDGIGEDLAAASPIVAPLIAGFSNLFD